MTAPANISPQEKQIYDTAVKQALGFLLSDENAKHIIEKAKVGNPKAAVVDAVMPVINNIYHTATSSGVQIEQRVILAAGLDVLSVVSQMLAVAGVIPENQVTEFTRDVGIEAVQRHNASVGGAAAAGGAQ